MSYYTLNFINEYKEEKSKNLFHVSETNFDNKILNPRIPTNYFTKNGYEDSNVKRICFAPTIDKCLRALSQKILNKEYYVHIPIGDFKVYKPNTNEVPDSKITGELWILKPVKVKCIGKIKVISDKGEDGLKYKYGENTAELYDWNWKWLEKYDDIVSESTNITKQKLTTKLVSEYKKDIKGLTHVRINSNTTGFVYFDNDNIIGYINIENKEKEIWIQALEVSNEYQGKGYGKYLLKECESNGARFLSVNKKNEKAINLYRSNRWKIYKETDTMYFMKK